MKKNHVPTTRVIEKKIVTLTKLEEREICGYYVN